MWYNAETNKLLLDARLKVLVSQDHWETQEIAFQERSLEFRQKQLSILKKAMTGEAGVLNYDRQARIILDRIVADFKAAYNRITVARSGLATLYGFTTPDFDLPTTNVVLVNNGSLYPLGMIDDAVIWIRKIVKRLVAFSQLDQSFSKLISLKNSTSGWVDRADDGAFLFRLSPALFSDHRYVRLRGLSAFISTASDQGLWSISANAPRAAWSIHGQGDAVPVDQRGLPTCHIGRVQSHQSPRPPEVGGSVSLVNASPIGNADDPDGAWVCRVSRHDQSANPLESVDDIWLELHVVGQPAQAG